MQVAPAAYLLVGAGAFTAGAFAAGASGCGRSAQPVRPAPLYAGVAGPLIIAHRGGALEAPENTMPAFEHGLKVGADWLELDVTLSADGEVVVIHDDTLERTTDGEGAVSAQPLAALRALDAGRPTWTDAQKERLALFNVPLPEFGDRFAGTPVPTLAEVLKLPGARIMIEMKKVPPQQVRELAQKTVAAVADAGAHDRVILGSFETDLLWAVNDIDPSLALIGIGESIEEIEAHLALPVTALAVRMDHVRDARAMAPPNVAVWAWTAYSGEMASAAVEQGANGVITDAPTEVIRTLRPEPSLYLEDDAPPATDTAPEETEPESSTGAGSDTP